MPLSRKEHSFRPKARLLSLLGEQLIKDSRIAVFELVKNAYDADATSAKVELQNIEDGDKAKIVIEDNGEGMDYKTVTNVWLTLGTDYRAKQRDRNRRTKRFKRYPLGEKGVGRFAAHKLGNRIELTTRMLDKPEVYVSIDWSEFEEDLFLDELKVEVIKREPDLFTGDKHGTRLVISELKEDWDRGSVRDLHRSVMAICSPFDTSSGFRPEMYLKPDNGWLEGLLDIEEIIKQALFKAECRVADNSLSYEYHFAPPSKLTRVENRDEYRQGLRSIPLLKELQLTPEMNRRYIGPLKIHLYMWDLSRDILEMITKDIKGFRQYLRQNGGIRVYRDGVRVYDYGEPENDWLELDQRRVEIPVEKLSNNLVIGSVSLKSNRSKGLIEKTNREGFIENKHYRKFKDIVLWTVEQIEQERAFDKERIRRVTTKKGLRRPVLSEIHELRKELASRHLLDDLGSYLDKISDVYVRMRDQLLTAAGAGLGLLVVIHEVEKGVDELRKAVERDTSSGRIKALVEHLYELIEGLGYLARKTGRRKISTSTLIERALFNTNYRLKYHNIQIINGIKAGHDSDLVIKCTSRLIISTIMNLIDNSIYWLDQKGGKKKQIYLGTSQDLDGPAIIIADNGPGFIDPPEKMVEPFWSRKKDGMGLGLYVAKQIMEAHEGKLEFPDSDEVDLYEGIDKAIVALVFTKEE